MRCFKGPRVLVVDDDALFRDLVAYAVRRNRHCQVDTVSNGHAALERVRTHVYDLILSDLRMPEMDGPTFYRRMQLERPELVERIVFMTSQVDHYAQFIRDVGAPLLGKPFRERGSGRCARANGLTCPVVSTRNNIEPWLWSCRVFSSMKPPIWLILARAQATCARVAPTDATLGPS